MTMTTNRITTRTTGPLWSSYRTVSRRRICIVRFLYINRAYAMKASATGAIKAPESLAAKHRGSPGAHPLVAGACPVDGGGAEEEDDEDDEDIPPVFGISELPLSKLSARNMTSTDILSHAKKVRSFAKKVLGSTLVFTKAFARLMLFIGMIGSSCGSPSPSSKSLLRDPSGLED